MGGENCNTDDMGIQDDRVLDGQVVSLRPPRHTESIAHLFYLDDPDTMEHLWFLTPQRGNWEHDDIRRRLEGFIIANDSGKAMVRSVFHLQDQRIIGQAGLVNIDLRNNSAELGIIIHSHYWGTCATTETCQLILEAAYEGLSLHRVSMRTPSNHLRCQKFLKNFGCAHEATLSDVYKKGPRYVDEAVLSLLSDEWPDAKRYLKHRALKALSRDRGLSVAPVLIQGI